MTNNVLLAAVLVTGLALATFLYAGRYLILRMNSGTVVTLDRWTGRTRIIQIPNGAAQPEVAVVREAFEALQRGDGSKVKGLLDPDVKWTATRLREFADADELDFEGALQFVDRLAAAIKSGDLRAHLKSVEQFRHRVVVMHSVFTKRGSPLGQECDNSIEFRRGRIVTLSDLN